MSSTNPNVLETPGVEVIRIPHREASNHYGGRVPFGPGGMLYLSTATEAGQQPIRPRSECDMHLARCCVST